MNIPSYSKYQNKKTVIDGITFDSKKEANRYGELKLLLKVNKISALEIHPSFIIQESFSDNDGKRERALKYKADFSYRDNEKGKYIVEDVKGFKTKEYLLKRKLFKYQHPEISFIEI